MKKKIQYNFGSVRKRTTTVDGHGGRDSRMDVLNSFSKNIGNVFFKVEDNTPMVTPNICIIGAGVSGLLAAIKLKTDLGVSSFTIFDENDDVGGGWLSAYPGHYSESPAHVSCYSFECKHDWSQNYVSQKEMLDYFRPLAHRYGLSFAIKLNCEVKSLEWDQKVKKWNATIFNKKNKVLKYSTFDIVINATGKFRAPEIPEEFQAFKGPIVHTGAWNPSIDLEGKVVGVVGSGRVPIDLIPAIEPKVKALHYYQDSPSFVLPKFQFTFPSFVQQIFDICPLALIIFRWILFYANEIFYFPVFLKNSIINSIAEFLAQKYRSFAFNRHDPSRYGMEPKYPFGSRQILHSNDFYKVMERGKVTIHIEPITHVEKNSITTSIDGQQHLEVLILAPADNYQEFFGPLKIIDKYGQDLLNRWKNARLRIRSYFGLTTSVTPNMFFLLGPHTTILHNNPMFMLECQMDYIVKLIEELMKRKAQVIEVEEEAEDEFLADLETQMKRTVWKTGKTGNWFSNSMGAVTALWPWTSIRYWLKTRTPDFTKFRFY